VFVTYWITPMTEAHLVLGKEKECLEKKLAQTANANGKFVQNLLNVFTVKVKYALGHLRQGRELCLK